MQLSKIFSDFAGRVAQAAGRPTTFLLCVATILAWALTGPIFGFSDTGNSSSTPERLSSLS
jgi:low affinity Fe/Cu permease